MGRKLRKCYIYTRVSTNMQVDGYSLDAQKDKLKKYADYEEMIIAGEYSDEGKSGKSVEGRTEFKQMLDDIQNNKDDIEFVLVFKLSRFGRNAADVLNSLQLMQDFGVNLICVEDGIDSSKDSGKLMISVLSAVAEIERDNILVQTMEGRKQKAREGRWNGGFAPYGYALENGDLVIQEDEAKAIKIIFDKYIYTNMGISGIAKYLNQQGIKKKARQNGKLTQFSSSFIRGVLDNPIYYGKIAFGRRKNEKINGTRNEYRIKKQDDFMLHDGVHKAIVSEDDWKQAQVKRSETGKKHEKIYSTDHCHLLSGLLKCPVCNAGMYGNVNRKKRKDGTHYKDYFYYACKHRNHIDGHSCTYRKQWNEDKVNDAVVEIVRELVKNPKFADVIKSKINTSVDTKEIEKEIVNYKKQLTQLIGSKKNIENQIDTLDVLDRHYERKLADLQERLDSMYDKITELEDLISEVEVRKRNIEKEKINTDNVYKYLLYFNELYNKFKDNEKKEFLNSFIKEVQIFEEAKENGQFLKKICFRFPIFYNGKDITEIGWDKDGTVETVCCLQRVNM